MSDPGTTVAIVDYGMGNLFSVLRACQTVGLEAEITSSSAVVQRAPAIILPGVGATGRAPGVWEREGDPSGIEFMVRGC